MEEKDVIIDTEEIAEFLFSNLIERGLVPKDDELEEIADIVFEYLLYKCIVEDIEEF